MAILVEPIQVLIQPLGLEVLEPVAVGTLQFPILLEARPIRFSRDPILADSKRARLSEALSAEALPAES